MRLEYGKSIFFQFSGALSYLGWRALLNRVHHTQSRLGAFNAWHSVRVKAISGTVTVRQIHLDPNEDAHHLNSIQLIVTFGSWCFARRNFSFLSLSRFDVNQNPFRCLISLIRFIFTHLFTQYIAWHPTNVWSIERRRNCVRAALVSELKCRLDLWHMWEIVASAHHIRA